MRIKSYLRRLLLAGAVASHPAGAQSYLPDQSFAAPYNEGANINEGFKYVAQTFTAGMSGTLGAVSLDIMKFGSPLPLDVQIRGVVNGLPDATVLGDAVVASGAPTLAEPLTFTQVVPMTAGTQYAIVVSYLGAPPVGPGQAEGDWRGTAGDTDYYPGGELCFSNDGNSWVSLPLSSGYSDQFFQTWVEPVPEPAITGLLALALPGLLLASRKRTATD